MSLSKIAYLAIAATATLAFTSSAQANTLTSFANGVSASSENQTINPTPGHVGDTYFGASETATFFYKKGVRKFEDGNLEKATAAFRASLRADGTKQLDKLSLHYLAFISQKEGNEVQAKDYAEAYMKIHEK